MVIPIEAFFFLNTPVFGVFFMPGVFVATVLCVIVGYHVEGGILLLWLSLFFNLAIYYLLVILVLYLTLPRFSGHNERIGL
jgi:hypothetical protein